LVKLQANATVLIFCDNKVEKQTGDEIRLHEEVAPPSRDCSEEESETAEKPDELPGSPSNKQNKRKSMVVGAQALLVKAKDLLKASYRGMRRETHITQDTGARNDSPDLSKKEMTHLKLPAAGRRH
jgi:hypothetical protein